MSVIHACHQICVFWACLNLISTAANLKKALERRLVMVHWMSPIHQTRCLFVFISFTNYCFFVWSFCATLTDTFPHCGINKDSILFLPSTNTKRGDSKIEPWLKYACQCQHKPTAWWHRPDLPNTRLSAGGAQNVTGFTHSSTHQAACSCWLPEQTARCPYTCRETQGAKAKSINKYIFHWRQNASSNYIKLDLGKH